MVPKDDWKIDAVRSALITIDLQRTFLEPNSPVKCPRAMNFVPQVNRLALKQMRYILGREEDAIASSDIT